MKGTLAQELDFENEARNSERCAEELKHFKFVVIPRVYWEQTSKVRLLSMVMVLLMSCFCLLIVTKACFFFPNSKRVLTAEFCEGCKVSNVEEIKRQGLSLKDVSGVTTGMI